MSEAVPLTLHTSHLIVFAAAAEPVATEAAAAATDGVTTFGLAVRVTIDFVTTAGSGSAAETTCAVSLAGKTIGTTTDFLGFSFDFAADDDDDAAAAAATTAAASF